LNNNTAIERFLSQDAFPHSIELIHRFSNSESGGGGSDSSLSYEPFTPPPQQSVSRETTLQDQFDNLITIKQQSVPFFDINVLHCSLENSNQHGKLYIVWVWIDLAMNVFIPFTGKLNT
jgi:hypothetical protein